MHTGPARRETPASPALFLRLAAVETPSGNLIRGAISSNSKDLRRIEEQRRHAKRHTPGAPRCDERIRSIRLLTFYTELAPMRRRVWADGRLMAGTQTTCDSD